MMMNGARWLCVSGVFVTGFLRNTRKTGRVRDAGLACSSAVLWLGTAPFALFGQCPPIPASDLVLPNTACPSSGYTSGNYTFQATNSISTSGAFGVNSAASVTFQAGSIIRLEPGFHASAGSAGTTFHASSSFGTSWGGVGREYVRLGSRIIAIESIVATPSAPSGPASGFIGVTYTYSITGPTSGVQYIFYWGDGSNSGWLTAGVTSASHIWPAVGTSWRRASEALNTGTMMLRA
jgi:hypothetical protein